MVFYSAEIEDKVSNLFQTLLIFLAQISSWFQAVFKFKDNQENHKDLEVKEIKAQETSLMPAKLLNRFSREDMAHLMTFLHHMK